VIDEVYESLKRVEEWGYPFVRDEAGNPVRSHLQGPEYMRLMRRVVGRAGARILDQSPALELLVDAHGVGGARGISRLTGRAWQVRAGAVVLATGGCAFLSKGLGCNVLTGDGLLMGAEAGAEVSGMEFTTVYGTSAAFGTVTRNAMLSWATFTREDGSVVTAEGYRGNRDLLARALLEGSVYAVLERADTAEKQAMLRRAHAVFFLPYDRSGIDPFTQRFPLTLRYEGTVRGVGGLRIADDDCGTGVAGLYVAGDAASRERSHGGQSGGGALNAAWAICSGQWAGAAAARFAAAAGTARRQLTPAGRYGLGFASEGGSSADAADSPDSADSAELVRQVQAQMLPLEINYFRSERASRAALRRLDELWPAVHQPVAQTVRGVTRQRETAAMLAAARWIHTAALARREMRAMHRPAEYPHTDPAQRHRLTLTGIDSITVRPDAVPLAAGNDSEERVA
jgi:succinate dehydrogenase/fumarate reductase flavoprotein subunit